MKNTALFGYAALGGLVYLMLKSKQNTSSSYVPFYAPDPVVQSDPANPVANAYIPPSFDFAKYGILKLSS